LDQCVFCEIVEGISPASVVFSDEQVMAFLDIQPVNPGHVLVIPKTHVERLQKLNSEVGCHMFKTAMVVAEGLRQSDVKCEGTNLFLADGEAAFQEVFHIHLHVIPRFKGDGFGLKFGAGYGVKPGREELDSIAEKIKSAIHK
jgi:histidine triad (HIT) family protein